MTDLSQGEMQRAREDNADLEVHGNPVQDQRVAYIVDLKMRLQWKRHSARRLAEQWGVSEGYVNNLATDANKVVRRLAVDPDRVAAELLPDLIKTYHAASQFVRDPKGVNAPIAKAKMAGSVASMAKVIAGICGLEAPKTIRAEVSGAGGGAIQVAAAMPMIFIPPESDD